MILVRLSAAAAVLVAGAAAACAPGAQRKAAEWRELPAERQSAYLAAVACLQQAPSALPADVRSRSRYDDFVYAHWQANELAHNTAAFLPWHRAFLANFDLALSETCNYKGPYPYWDWSVDSQAPERSVIWRSNAFGGDGQGWDDCLQNGPFAGTTSVFPTQGCVSRNWRTGQTTFQGRRAGNMMGALYSPDEIAFIIHSFKTYDEFRFALESHPHNVVHEAIGGDMSDPTQSVNDPIFFLHHRNIDRIWSVWQSMYPELAKTYNGNRRSRAPNVNDARPSDIMDLFGLGRNFPASEFFDHTSGGAGGLMCYDYTTSVVPNRPRSRRSASKRSSRSKGTTILQLIAAFTSGDHGSYGRPVAQADGKSASSSSAHEEEEDDEDLPTSRYDGSIEYNGSGNFSDYDHDSPYGSPYRRDTPDSYDRRDMYNIRYTQYLSEEFFQKWPYPEESIIRIRKSERHLRKFVEYVNGVDGYVSPVCLGRNLHGQKYGWRSVSKQERQMRRTVRKLMCDRAKSDIGPLSSSWSSQSTYNE